MVTCRYCASNTQTDQGAGTDDTIWVKIPNPMETDTLDPIDYSILGYSTYYWSQNSDAIDVYQNVIAVEEDQNIGFDVNTMEVSPNPSHGTFNVKCDVSGTGYATLRLYDVFGRDIGLLWQGDVKNGSNIIDVHGQSKGIYFLILESNELEVKQKIVID